VAISPEALDAMVRAGASASMITEVVKADLKAASDAADAVTAAKRARAAEAKKRQRAALRGDDEVHKSPEDLRGQSETYEDIAGLGSPIKENPHTPKKTTPPTSLRSESQSTRRAAFEELWSAYPKRAGSNPKQPAEEKFCRLLKASDDPTGLASEIVDGARRYAAVVASADPKFTAQAITWLNQGRWKDDHVDPANGVRDGPAPRPVPVNNRRAAINEILDFARDLEDH